MPQTNKTVLLKLLIFSNYFIFIIYLSGLDLVKSVVMFFFCFWSGYREELKKIKMILWLHLK